MALWLAFLVFIFTPIANGAEATVKVYSCPAGAAQATADRLREEFGMIPGVRVAADERVARIIVQAPPETQAHISQRLAGLFSAPGPARQPGGMDSRPASPELEATRGTANLAVTSRPVPLQHATVEQFEASLWRMLGNRLSGVASQTPQVRRYRLALVGGSAVDLLLHPGARQVVVEGAGPAVDACARMVQVLDGACDGSGREARLVSLQSTGAESVRRAVGAIHDATSGRAAGLPMYAQLLQPTPPAPPPAPPSAPPTVPDAPPAVPGAPPAAPGVPAAPGQPAGEGKPDDKDSGSLLNPVQIEMLEGLDILVIRGSARDVEQVMSIINQIEKLSTETEPAFELLMLRHVDCQAMAALVRSLYSEVYQARQGSVSITPIVKPNALLIVGRVENVRTVIDLVRRLDQPVAPNSQFQVFQLQHAAPLAVQTAIQEFYADRGGLGTLVRTTIDARTNALIVQASPRDMAEVAELVRRVDVPSSKAVNEVRVLQLEHSLAAELSAIMQSAIGMAVSGVQTTPGMQQFPGQQPGGQLPGGQQPGGTRAGTDQRSVMLRFLTIDAKGQRLLKSGILSDVRITPDVRANALVISAPAESIELIEGLARQLDRLPAAEAQIKVFTIVNGDALGLAETLRTLFGLQASGAQTGVGLFGQMMMQTAAGAGENSLVTLRFAVDTRTNSIIASGAQGDLNVVEAILLRLDDSDVRQRKSVVFRLKNSPAIDVANSINQFLTSERQVQQLTPGLTSPFEQLEQEVVVVPEPVSNSLILSATPRFFDEIRDLIEQLDARPPMVMIQVLIGEVQLGNTNEFGMELGLQHSVLFDRSVLSNIQYLTTTTTPSGQSQVTTQQIIAADNRPGFNFNNQPLGNSGSSQSLAHAGVLGPQGLSNFAVGRTNDRLGFGGLVLSASSESISVLLRALNECHRLEVLERPQIMTMDNQPAFVQVGQRVPRITATQPNEFGIVNSITMENVGLILGVTPRISPDGLVVMEIDAEKSEVGPEAEGIPVAISEGVAVRSPRINTTTAQTTVSALSGQTVILGGLIHKSKTEFHRKVPLLGDIPVLGRLFRYDGVNNERRELLIIMTPHIVKNEADADNIRRAEAARMSWCMCDVVQIYGEAGLRRRTDEWSDAETQVIYPDMKQSPPPSGPQGMPPGSELVPSPQGTPTAPPPLVPLPPGQAAPLPGTAPGPIPGPTSGLLPRQRVSPASNREPTPAFRAPAAPRGTELHIRESQQARYEAPVPPGNYPAAQPGVQNGVYQQPAPQMPPGNYEQPAVYHQPISGQPPQPQFYR